MKRSECYLVGSTYTKTEEKKQKVKKKKGGSDEAVN